MSTLFDPQLPMSRREAIALGLKGGLGAVSLVGAAQWLAGCAMGRAAVGSAATTGLSPARLADRVRRACEAIAIKRA